MMSLPKIVQFEISNKDVLYALDEFGALWERETRLKNAVGYYVWVPLNTATAEERTKW